MLRPDDLYEIVDESVATGAAATPKVLVHSLDGFMDAGQAGRVTADHLLETLENRLLARFDVDLLHDYRARRPLMMFNEDHWESYESLNSGEKNTTGLKRVFVFQRDWMGRVHRNSSKNRVFGLQR